MDQLLTDFGPIFRSQSHVQSLFVSVRRRIYAEFNFGPQTHSKLPTTTSRESAANSQQSAVNSQRPKANSQQLAAQSQQHTHTTANSTRPVRLCVCMHVRKYLSTSLFPHDLTSPACSYVHMSSKTSALIRTCIFIRQSSHTSLSTTLTPSSLLLLASTLLR